MRTESDVRRPKIGVKAPIDSAKLATCWVSRGRVSVSLSESSQSGQVVEAWAYHLELVPKSEADAIHIDVYLQTSAGAHEPIGDAKVVAQVQLPDGSQHSLDMKYDMEGKHYTAALLTTAAGEYKVAVLSDVNCETVNGRFSFTK